MTLEEIIVKLQMDGNPLAQSLRELKENLKNTGETGHKSFVHAGSAASQFHKLVHQISESSPILGSALRLAMSPLVGIISGATVLMELFREKLKEVNKALDETAALNAKPLYDVRQATHEAALEMARLNREFERWIASHEHPGQAITDALENQMTALGHQSRLYGELLQKKKELGLISGGQFDQQMDFHRRDALMNELSALTLAHSKITTEQVKTGQAVEKLKPEAGNQARLKDIASLGETIQNVAELLANAKSREASAAPHGFTDYLTMPFTNPELAKELIAAKNDIKNYTASLKGLTKKQEELTDRQKQAEEKLKDQQRASDELRNSEISLSKRMQAAQAALLTMPQSPRGSPESPFPLSMGELAQYNTWPGRIARRIEQLRGWGRDATAAGNLDRANEIQQAIEGTPADPGNYIRPGVLAVHGHRARPAIPGLIDQLPKGITTEQIARERAKAQVSALLEALDQSRGVPVAIKEVAE